MNIQAESLLHQNLGHRPRNKQNQILLSEGLQQPRFKNFFNGH